MIPKSFELILGTEEVERLRSILRIMEVHFRLVNIWDHGSTLDSKVQISANLHVIIFVLFEILNSLKVGKSQTIFFTS